MYQFSLFLISENKKYNLTSIKTLSDILYKHFVDSLLVSKYIPEHSSVIDIGCGAGFPSVPLAVFRPDLKITALDSTAKKIAFIEQSAIKFSLKNLHCIFARAETAARELHFRDNFDISTARAVSALPIISELSTPFLKKGGQFIAMKGPDGMREYNTSHDFFHKLNCGNSEIVSYELKNNNITEPRTLIIVKKLEKTSPDFPRNYSQITKKPLS